MFTISVIQNERDENWEALYKFLTNEFTESDIEGIFDFKYAPLSVKNYAAMKDYPPSVGVFIFDVNHDGGIAIDMIKAIKKSSVFKDIPVVLFSDSNDEAYKKSCVNAGAEKAFRRSDFRKLADYINAIATKKRDHL